MNDLKLNFGLFTFPLVESNVTPTSHMVDIVDSLSNYTCAIMGNGGSDLTKGFKRIRTYEVPFVLEKAPLRKIAGFIRREVQFALLTAKLNQSVDCWIFFFGGDEYILPMVTAKLHGKRVVLVKPGSSIRNARYSNDILSLVLAISSRINCYLSNSIILYSAALIPEWSLEKYRHKILITHRHFLDFHAFNVTAPFSNRPPLIGYIGRLSGEKGVLNFIQALPPIIGDREDLYILVGGDGQLRETIEDSLQEEGLTTRVRLPGWISHDDLPRYLNQLRLLVLPSYTEGLPNIMLEAMACGTPVLATPIGAIPDVIVDGKTGFIMESNSPECIAENVIRVLNSPELEQIADNGRRFVEENFTFERVVARWKDLFDEI